MSDPNGSGGDRTGTNRRDFLEWASALGLTAVSPATIAKIAKAKDKRKEPDPIPEEERGDPASDVHVTHDLEREGVQKRLERFDRSGDPTDLFHPFLLEGLEKTDHDEFSVVVRTIGEENKITTKGPYERDVYGWKPTETEIARLSEFGTVGHAAEFSGTSLTFHEVSRDDLKRVALQEFVVGLTRSPPRKPAGVESTSSSGIPASTLRSNEYCWFSSVDGDYDIPSEVKIGIIDTGYESERTPYDEPWANRIGIKYGLAKDFTDDNDWTKDTYDSSGYSHGTAAADTVAYMIDDNATHNDLFVPLKVFSDSTDTSNDEHVDNVRKAIEYCINHEIPVISDTTVATAGTEYCTSELCDLYETYAGDSGYIPATTTGNYWHTDKVDHPGGSWYTIGTGGINGGSCSSDSKDYPRDSNSNYDPEHLYDNPDSYVNYCTYCTSQERKEPVPTVYAAYDLETDADTVISGTSFAGPVAAAAAIIMQSNGLYSYSSARNLFGDMTWYQVCPDEAAKTGQLVDAHEAHYQTK